jgi:hypothetical protein
MRRVCIACTSANFSQCATLSFTGCLQGGIGAAGVPQMAQDHGTRQHVADSENHATEQQYGCVAAAAQLGLSASHPEREHRIYRICHC